VVAFEFNQVSNQKVGVGRKAPSGPPHFMLPWPRHTDSPDNEQKHAINAAIGAVPRLRVRKRLRLWRPPSLRDLLFASWR
jgi:hypothetical protein